MSIKEYRDIRCGVLIVSDKGYAGKREDKSGEILSEMLKEKGFLIVKTSVVPDDRVRIKDTIITWVDEEGLALILTSGGTGVSPRDVTPQATEDVIEYQVPGIAEAMRAASLKKTPHAVLSRAVAGVRKTTLIINLPGSPKGARENFSVILPALGHALNKLAGDPSECAS